MLKGKQQTFITRFLAILLVLVFVVSIAESNAFAQEDKGGFSLQVTPSPLVATIKPGGKTSLELRIRNTNTKTEDLKMGLRSFTVSELTGEINIGTGEPLDVNNFVSFSEPIFTLQAGQWFTQHIVIDTPNSAGFTYSFAVTISRQTVTLPATGAASIQGSVAVFTLLSVDKPGATRKFEIKQVETVQNIYEYLPASFNVTYKNTGNTLVRPTGNLFIQRLSSDTKPIEALPINASGGYILPGTSRTIAIEWKSGFPHYESQTSNGQTTKSLIWNWAHISDLRIGRYVAKVVAVYDDGQRDVPVTGEVAFWVIPWKILLGFSLISGLILAGIVSIFRGSFKALIRKSKKKNHEHEKDS